MSREKKTTETPGMNAEEIRALREQERIDSVCSEPPSSRKALYPAVNYLTVLAAAAVILTGLYYAGMLTGTIRSLIQPYLGMVDDSSGFLTDMLTALLNLLLFTVIAVLFGFALAINFARHGRPREVWGSQVKYIVPAAFLSCLVYAAFRFLSGGGAFAVSGSVLSRCLYYVNMIVIVPAANVLLFLVLPSAVIRMLLTVVSDTKERTELPQIIVCALIMALGLIGVNPAHITLFGFPAFLFALVLSALCSFLYHRTNVIWCTVLLYAGVSGLYLLAAALLSQIA